MELKVGERYLVKPPNLKEKKAFGWAKEMDSYIGEIVTIRSISSETVGGFHYVNIVEERLHFNYPHTIFVRQFSSLRAKRQKAITDIL